VHASVTPNRTTEGYRPGTAAYRRVVAALFVAGLATFAMPYSTQAILPELAGRFAVSAASSTLTVSMTTMGLGVGLLIAGPLSDVVGRTRLIHLSLTASSIVAAGCALAPNWSVLLVLRLLLGMTLAGLPAVATAYLREELHPSSHGRAAGLYIGGTAIGGMSGRLLTGFIADAAGWRWALATVAVLGFACAATVQLLLPASRRFTPAPSGVRPLLGMTRRALSDRALLALYAIGGTSVGAFVAVFNTVGFRLGSAPFDLGLGAASLIYLVYPLGTLAAVIFGRMSDTRGRRAVLPLGCLLAVSGGLLTLPAYLPLVVVGLGLLTAGFFAVHGVASGWVPVRAHAGGVAGGQAASLYLFSFYLGSSTFGTLGGSFWSTDGWPGVVALATLLLCLAAGLSLVLRRTPTLLSRTSR
jgi:YNFM family putative membrane transporter